jgi:ATP-dependent exoDNAse (exonuclease V) beta subunit
VNVLVDQAERDRFVQAQGRNISVIAPAGVGKTTAIVDRIVHLARLPQDESVDRLSRLIVVTYSVRAAQQMQQRARVGIRNADVSPRVQRAFQQTFFGTIHSYCVRLLDRFGHYLGLPSPVGLLQDDAELWNRFLLHGLPAGIARNEGDLFSFYSSEKLYLLGKEISPGDAIEAGPMPALRPQPLLDYRGASLHHSTQRSIESAQKRFQLWSESWAKGERFRPLPPGLTSDKATEFISIWNETFAPLHEWLRVAALAFGRRVANAYETFRLSEALMTYDDQVRLALRVLETPQARAELASERISVLLDEAQDTDPRQFEVLLRVAGLGSPPNQSDDQSFSIVGDFQQAIYAPRSDLARYRGVHDEISVEPRGATSRLQVTFRCDAAIIDFVNRVFPSVLNNAAGQSAFETLVPRDDAGPGQVIRWLCPDEPEHAAGVEIKSEVRSAHEAKYIAQRLRELGPAGLGASDWSQVAILCPRRNWLAELQRELVKLELPVQMHSSDEQGRDRIAGTWLTALVWIAAHPEDAFEIAGVLREILGVADSDMARFTGGEGNKLRLDLPPFPGGQAVEAALDVLREACHRADELPLLSAVRQLVEKTHLRERLRLIADPDIADRELDDFLAVIAGRAADGATLAELAQELRLGLAQPHPVEEEIRDAIQLMTSYKSKGLEWQAVIVPFVFRAIGTKRLIYPRVDTDPHGQERVSRDKHDFSQQIAEFVNRREMQQFQRLLYVVSTRAKRTLVWIDNETLYTGQKSQGRPSGGELLGFAPGGQNRANWQALLERPSLPVEIAPPPAVVLPALVDLPTLSEADVQRAVTHAGNIPRRITPHALAVHTAHDAEPEKRSEQEDAVETRAGPGILYGTWWHEFVQAIPWDQPREEWQRKFVEARVHAPNARRAAREWKLFLDSPLAKWLAEPGRLVQVEWPFLWQGADGRCLEGVMDLAVYTEGDAAWHVIDWKTNQVGADGAAGVVAIYRAQIEAYVGALREMLAVEVKGSLYLTQTGGWEPVA